MTSVFVCLCVLFFNVMGVSLKYANKIQHEFFLLFSVMDENKSWYLEKNIEEFGSSDLDPDKDEFQESNKMHGMCLCVLIAQ